MRTGLRGEGSKPQSSSDSLSSLVDNILKPYWHGLWTMYPMAFYFQVCPGSLRWLLLKWKLSLAGDRNIHMKSFFEVRIFPGDLDWHCTWAWGVCSKVAKLLHGFYPLLSGVKADHKKISWSQKKTVSWLEYNQPFPQGLLIFLTLVVKRTLITGMKIQVKPSW